ncbi:MAG TPA: transaldolase [Ardenticatenaceae bacterium]|nr:transaldolase [Ardenticatenaceae bacterium]
MAKNPLFELQDYGQSIWYDSIRRGLVTSGGLQALVDEYAVVGVTSNPTIFEKAIGGSADYDEDIRALSEAGHRAPQIFEHLATDDVRLACDVLLPIYEQSGHVDGRVSIEVGPHVAFEAEATIEEARRLWQTVDRPNLMVKIPGTPEGIPAIEQMIYEGVSINITLLFAVSMYEQVMEAYLRGLERRVAEGKPIDQIHSVASFFVSRVDSMVDKELEARIRATDDPREQERLRGLLGKAAIANAKLAYQAFKRIFQGPRWETLVAKRANLQRPLWASTSTKNPAYPDTMYVAELVGPHTVNTVPENTLLLFADHGVVRGNTVEEDVEGAWRVVQQLAEAGIDLQDITERRLTAEGVRSFGDSFDQLIEALRKKRDAIVASQPQPQTA